MKYPGVAVKVAVTGGAGFIGGHVVDLLIERGHEPLVFDHMGRAHRADVNVMLGDARDDVSVNEMAAHVEGIIHLASVLGTQETVNNPRPAVLTNVTSGLNVFEAGCQYGLPVVNICVGNAGMANPYSASKTCVESLGQMFVNDRGLALNQVRAVNAYGSRQSVASPYGSARVRKIVPSFVCRALTGASVEVYGDGNQVSDMVHVSDVARVLVLSLEHAAAGDVFDSVIEVGPEEHFSVNQVANLIIDSCVSAGFDRVDVSHLPMRPGETPGAVVIADTSSLSAVNISGYDLVKLPEGINNTVDWFVNNWLPDFEASRG